ncbi:hypothetical protein [Nocardia thailandica]
MATDNNTMWVVDYSDDFDEDFAAPSAAAAAQLSEQTYPGHQIVAVRARTLAEMLDIDFGSDWLALLAPAVGIEGDWLVLHFTAAINADGVLDTEHIANFRTLSGLWAGLPNVRTDGGRIALRLDAPAPSQAWNILDDHLHFGGPIEPRTHQHVLAELALVEHRSTRVAYRHPHTGRWMITTCPATALGGQDSEPAAVPGLPHGQSLVVVDALPGFPAGCSTWAGLGGEELDTARAEHLGCAHVPFRPAT